MLHRLFTVLCLSLGVMFSTAVAAQDLAGAYKGVAAAMGMRLQFARAGDIYEGLFADRTGDSQIFEADALDAGAEGVVERQGRKVFMRFVPDGAGLQMVSIPISEDGDMIIENTQTLLFIREDLELPPLPTRYVEPPLQPGGTIDPEAFVESYAFWPSESVSYGFGMVRGRYRTLIRLHATVQADILWKMCQSQAAPAELAEALRGQGVNCQDVLLKIGGAIQAGEPFNRFKADVLAQKAQLTEAIRCSIDYRRNDPVCKRSGARVAAAAVSLETVGSVLRRY